MHWIAPREKDAAAAAPQKHLREINESLPLASGRSIRRGLNQLKTRCVGGLKSFGESKPGRAFAP